MPWVSFGFLQVRRSCMFNCQSHGGQVLPRTVRLLPRAGGAAAFVLGEARCIVTTTPPCVSHCGRAYDRPAGAQALLASTPTFASERKIIRRQVRPREAPALHNVRAQVHVSTPDTYARHERENERQEGRRERCECVGDGCRAYPHSMHSL